MHEVDGSFVATIEEWIEPLCLDCVERWIGFATSFDVAIFQKSFRQDLQRRFGERGLKLIEVAVLLSRVHDPAEFNSLRTGVAKLAKEQGVRLNDRGKRPKAEMEALIAGVAPVLLRLNVPLACGSYSLLVVTLGEISKQLGVEGDVRSVLRRIRKRKKALAEFSYSVAIQAALDGARIED